MNQLIWRLPVVICTFIIASCGTINISPSIYGERPSVPISSETFTSTPFQPENNPQAATATEINGPGKESQTPPQNSVWISPAVPEYLRQVTLDSGLSLSPDPDFAHIRLDITQTPDSHSAEWIYALVAPFPTLTDTVQFTDFKNAWNGQPSGSFSGRKLWMAPSTLEGFSRIWGTPVAGFAGVSSPDQILNLAWSDGTAWAIVPFESLDPRWKVITIDGQSPILKDFNAESYPLKIYFGMDPVILPILSTNRDSGKLTVVAMTGTTALVRATADRMERKGVLYPGEEIRSVLRTADITHISNEVSFVEGCPTPDPWTSSMLFCSDPRYIALLEDVGTDVVELTGNHLLDYGPKPFLTTLEKYDQFGWKYFGGGRNLHDSLQPVLFQDHGNKIAFLGCNHAGPPDDWATDTRPGSAPCDYDQLTAEISSLRSSGYLPIMTFQYNEYYQPNPTDYEQHDFLQMALAGAVIVSGSQAHVPATMEFSGESFIHYGLGNLFFDQMSHQMPDGSIIYDTRNVFVDRHVIYNGRYISTELLSYIIEDYSRPRLMTEPERFEFLKNIFRAGGW